MPNFGWLDGNQENVYAIQRAGQSMSDAVLGLQANRIAQERFLIQQAIEQERLRQQSQFQDRSLGIRQRELDADTAYKQGRLNMEMPKYAEDVAASKAARAKDEYGLTNQQMLARDMQAYYNAPEGGALKATLRSQMAGAAAPAMYNSPHNIALQLAQMEAARDPQKSEMLAFQEPLYANVGYGQNRVRMPGGETIASNQRFEKTSLRNDPDYMLADLLTRSMKGQYRFTPEYKENQRQLSEVMARLRERGIPFNPETAGMDQQGFGDSLLSTDEGPRNVTGPSGVNVQTHHAAPVPVGPTAPPAQAQSLKPGTVYKGHVYIGGDPATPAAWRPVQ